LPQRYLKSEASSKDKRSNAGDESGEERVEREGADEAAVDKLHDPGEEDVDEVGVDHFQTFRSVVHVPECKHDKIPFSNFV